MTVRVAGLSRRGGWGGGKAGHVHIPGAYVGVIVSALCVDTFTVWVLECIHVHMCVYMCTCVYASVHVGICALCLNMCLCMSVCIFIYMQVCMRVCNVCLYCVCIYVGVNSLYLDLEEEQVPCARTP